MSGYYMIPSPLPPLPSPLAPPSPSFSPSPLPPLPFPLTLHIILYYTVLAKQAEKKAIMERIEQGKKAKNNRKRSYPPNDGEMDAAVIKRPKYIVSSTPSPLMLNSSRPASGLSMINSDVMNGGGGGGGDELDHQGSTDGSEVNSEVSGPGTTPIRHPSKSRITPRKPKRTAAPLGGRGRVQKSNKKTGSGSAAASAGAIAGAKAATSAAYAVYGISSHLVSPSPSGGTSSGPQSTHSSPRVSPVPMAFVATSLVTSPQTGKSLKAPSSLTYTKGNNV